MNVIRLCVDCHAHEAIRDGDRCRECLNDYLRATRPAPLKEAAWITYTREHRLAKDLTHAA